VDEQASIKEHKPCPGSLERNSGSPVFWAKKQGLNQKSFKNKDDCQRRCGTMGLRRMEHKWRVLGPRKSGFGQVSDRSGRGAFDGLKVVGVECGLRGRSFWLDWIRRTGKRSKGHLLVQS